jgi:hypothetical protein
MEAFVIISNDKSWYLKYNRDIGIYSLTPHIKFSPKYGTEEEAKKEICLFERECHQTNLINYFHIKRIQFP